MRRFNYGAYEISSLLGGGEEHLRQDTIESAHAAVLMCFGLDRRADYLTLEFLDNSGDFGEISPYATWGTLEKFEELLQNHVLAAKAQLNIDLDLDTATEAIILMAIETKNHS